jgi:hypothetical protein
LSEDWEGVVAAVSSARHADEPARTAAYAELVSAVLDLRNPSPTRDFDAAIAAAVTDGRLPEPLARELRWLQRQSVRDIVEHAAQVLPATLVALEGGEPGTAATYESADDLEQSRLAEQAGPAGLARATPPAPQPSEAPADPSPAAAEAAGAEEENQEPPAPPVDLTARRLLVAGLRPIDDPPFP